MGQIQHLTRTRITLRNSHQVVFSEQHAHEPLTSCHHFHLSESVTSQIGFFQICALYPFYPMLSLFVSLFTLTLLFFCQKQSVDFPTDYPVLPQSQSWVDLWRESREEEEERRRKMAERKKPNHKGLCFELKSLSPVLTSVSVFPCALC